MKVMSASPMSCMPAMQQLVNCCLYMQLLDLSRAVYGRTWFPVHPAYSCHSYQVPILFTVSPSDYIQSINQSMTIPFCRPREDAVPVYLMMALINHTCSAPPQTLLIRRLVDSSVCWSSSRGGCL
jgi:hypothetical protein